jgi:hypothetical protein
MVKDSVAHWPSSSVQVVMGKDYAGHWPSAGIQVVMVRDSAAGHLQLHRLLWLRILLLLAIFRCTGYG